MRVIDTSAWIEVLVESRLGLKLKSELPARAQWIVPTLVQLELAKWLIREGHENAAGRVVAFTLKCAVAPLDTKLALGAAHLCGEHKLSTADGIVYDTARAAGAELVTCDAHFEGLPGVLYFAKEEDS
jgi:uncharacterized protein